MSPLLHTLLFYSRSKELPSFFADISGVGVDLVCYSNVIQLPLGISGTWTVVGGLYSLDGGDYISTPSEVSGGETIRGKATSSSEYETAVNVVFSVDAVEYGTWTITTGAEGSGWVDENGAFFVDENGDYWG